MKEISKPLVSIIMPTYNSADFVKESINAIKNQIYTNWELLVTDDCSTDSTVEILEQYAKSDSRIKVYRLNENSGAGMARNNSIKEASGNYIAFCDSDDVWKPEKLDVQIKFMEKNNVDICYSSYLMCNESLDTKGIYVCYREVFYSTILKDDRMGFLTLIYNAQNIGKVYMPSLRKRQDWAFKILLMKRCPRAMGIVEPLAYYRIRRNSISRNKLQLIKYNVKVYEDILHCSGIEAWIRFLFIFAPYHILKLIRIKLINR